MKIIVALLLAIASCATLPKVRDCAVQVGSDLAVETLPAVRRALANPTFDVAKAELAGLVIKHGYDFIRCLVINVKATVASEFASDPSTPTVERNADAWLEESQS